MRSRPATEWQYEPKWDGFRCLVFRDGDKVELQSKSGQPLTRYFPELVEAVLRAEGQDVRARRRDRGARRAARSRSTRCCSASIRRRAACEKLAAETPALLIVFDLLADARRRAAGRAAAARAPHAAGSASRTEYFQGRRAHPAVAGDDAARATRRLARARRRDARRHHRQAARPRPTARATAPACRRSRTTAAPTAWSAASATTKASRWSARCCSGSTTRRPAASRRLHLDDRRDGQAGADREAGKADRAAGLHRQRARRPEPLVDRALGGMAAAQAEARGRGALRPFHRRPLPPRHDSCCAGGRTSRRGNARWTRSSRRSADLTKLLR